MNPLCNFCGAQRAVVYCESDEARLCLPCDAYVHAANSVSGHHIRIQLCDRCHDNPASSRCPEDHFALCHLCDLAGGCPSETSDAPHRRVSECFYTDCPTPAEFSAAGSVDESYSSPWEVPFVADLSIAINRLRGISEPIKLEPTWITSSTSNDASDSASSFSCDEYQSPFFLRGSNLPKASSLAQHDFMASLPPCMVATSSIMQTANGNADKLLMNLNGNSNINLNFPPGNKLRGILVKKICVHRGDIMRQSCDIMRKGKADCLGNRSDMLLARQELIIGSA